MYDHVDQRVTDLSRSRPVYGALMAVMGFTQISEDPESICWYDPRDPKRQPFFSLVRASEHQPNGARVAFRAESRQNVDRLAEAALRAGARSFEAPHECTEYTPRYYATFFEDAEGNKLEVCCRN